MDQDKTSGEVGKDLAVESAESPRPAPERRVEFSGKYWREIGAFVPADAEDRRLRQVRIEPCAAGGALLIATDGKVMAIFRDANAVCSEAVSVPYKTVEGVVDGDVMRVQPNVILRMEGGRVVGGAVYPDVDHRFSFPNWRQAIPDTNGSPMSFLNPQQLVQCALNSTALGVVSTSPDKPALVRPMDRKDIFAVVMPYRASNDESTALAEFRGWLNVPEISATPEVNVPERDAETQ